MNLRRVLMLLGLGLALALLAGQVRQLLREPTVWPPDDFVEYWAAARLTIEGKNPYDPAELLPLQVAAGRDTREAVMMWNPPWALTVVLPLGFLPAREAQLLWLVLNLAALGFCGDRLWLLFGGSSERRWLGWLAAAAFVPSLFALHAGQIGPLLLLGVVLFLMAERRGRPFLAGAATVLLAVKPHLAYLVWAAVACDALRVRRFGVILGSVVAGVFCTLLPMLFDPGVLGQYSDAMAHRPPDQWLSPTLGSLLRLAFGPEQFRLQFVPVLLGLGWFARHWRQHRTRWDWREQTPLLVLVSFATAPYGAWPFDLVLLLAAVVPMLLAPAAEGRPSRTGVLVSLAAIDLACLVMNLCAAGSFWFLWVAPAMLALYAVAMRPASSQAMNRRPTPTFEAATA